MDSKVNRRDFVKSAVGASAAIGALSKTGKAGGKILGANDQVSLGLIGAGGRGRDLLRWAIETGQKPLTPAHVTAVCDVYVKRRRLAAEFAKCDAVADYHEMLERTDI